MLQQPLKKILVEKLSSGFICFIRYNSGPNTYERPFRLARHDDNLMSSPQVNLTDCVTGKFMTLNFADVVIFHLHYVDDLSKCIEKSNEIINKYKEVSKNFDFLTGEAFYNVVFNVEAFANESVLVPGTTNLNVLAFLNLIRSADIEDYRKLLSNDPVILNRLKIAWKALIFKKYYEVMSSLDKEKDAATDDVIKQEIESIKDVIKSIPKDIDKDLDTKNTYILIVGYWPTLLLPRSKVLDTP